jgi:hypothetical protein
VNTYDCKKLSEAQAWQAIKEKKCYMATGSATGALVYVLIIIGVLFTMFYVLAKNCGESGDKK